jgi:hypothetical protein
VRVFDVASRSQPFMLRHEWPVASVAWLDGAAGLMTIGINGVITKWTPLMVSPGHLSCATLLSIDIIRVKLRSGGSRPRCMTQR